MKKLTKGLALLLALILMLALCACNDDGKKTSADNSGNNSDALSAESVIEKPKNPPLPPAKD